MTGILVQARRRQWRLGMNARRQWRLGAGVALALVCIGGAGFAADAVVAVSQRDRAFTAASITVPLGGVLKVDNDDEFVHQVYINAPTMTYESDEQEPGKSIDIRFTKAGTFEVRCHIHPRMLLQVTVR